MKSPTVQTLQRLSSAVAPAIAVAALVAAVGWCSGAAEREAEAAVTEALKEANGTINTDPFATYERLGSAIAGAEKQRGCAASPASWCNRSNAVRAARDLRWKSLVRAVEVNDADALLLVMQEPWSIEQGLALAAKDRLLQLLREKQASGRINRAGALLYASGVFVPRDFEKAEDLFGKAVAQGEVQAANDAAAIFAATGQPNKALTWAEQCVLPCARVTQRVEDRYVHTDLAALEAAVSKSSESHR